MRWVLAARLGNMTLLEAGRMGYLDKRDLYVGSSFRAALEMERRFPEWTTARIEVRRAAMAKVAAAAWRVPQLS